MNYSDLFLINLHPEAKPFENHCAVIHGYRQAECGARGGGRLGYDLMGGMGQRVNK